MEEGVKRFQARHGLPLDGVLGKYTLDAMNISADTRLMQLRTNLTRVKAITEDLGQRYVMVNIPAAYIEAVENNRVAQRHTAIVGRITRPTPILDSKIYNVTLNPYWTAPRSIVEKDIVPLMRKDPTYLTNNKIRLFDGKGSEVDPTTIDWNAEKAPDLMFRQDPGKINAMASTKINFHNEHATYMHDTPQQGLFNKLSRFEFSGCVRCQNVRDLTTWILRDTPGWDRQQMEADDQDRRQHADPDGRSKFRSTSNMSPPGRPRTGSSSSATTSTRWTAPRNWPCRPASTRNPSSPTDGNDKSRKRPWSAPIGAFSRSGVLAV